MGLEGSKMMGSCEEKGYARVVSRQKDRERQESAGEWESDLPKLVSRSEA